MSQETAPATAAERVLREQEQAEAALGYDEMAPAYATVAMGKAAAKGELPERGLPPRIASRLIADEMNLDGNPSMNLASFVTTFMEPEAEHLMMLGMQKNYIDIDEYSQTYDLNTRCVDMIGSLFHCPSLPVTGSSTIGSSEAIMLAGKWLLYWCSVGVE
jgi:glutamate decarboxylase